MSSKRQAKKILKLYGKALYASRLEYMNSFEPEASSFVQRLGYRRIMKRCVVIVVILTLLFSMLVVGAGALGIKFFGYSLFQTKTHTEISGGKEPSKTDEKPRFYEPGFIPEGYTLVSKDEFAGVELSLVYGNEQGTFIHIGESISEDPSVSINNEDCVISTEVIGEHEVYIYDYYDEEAGSIYLLEIRGTFVTIKSNLSATIMKKIVLSFK